MPAAGPMLGDGFGPGPSTGEQPVAVGAPSHFVSGAFMSSGLGNPARTGDAASAEYAGQQIGPYTLLSVIAEGGFGMVWLAERRQPFEQRVAIKVIKPGMDSKEVLARFERERQTLALLDHPGIARVIDGGLTTSGRPYFVMDYVQGRPITTFCDSRKMDQRQRLRLFVEVCRTVHAAHTKGVIHRDLKPANILVELTSHPGEVNKSRKIEPRIAAKAVENRKAEPWPRVIDFGMAKVIGQQSSQFARTEMVMFVGTLEYMSPEQAMSKADIDTRSDVYSLGVVLYELLTGTLPLPSESLRSVPPDQARSLVGRGPTRRPSEALKALPEIAAKAAAGARGVSIAELHNGLRSELELIPLTAMHADPERRYQSALQLAEDVERYLTGLPLVAAPDTAWYRLSKTVRRNKLATAALVGLVLVLAAGLVTTNLFRAATADALGQTEEALSRATEAEATAIAATEATAAQLRRSEERLYAGNVSAAAPLLRSGAPIAAISRLERCTDEQKKRWEWQLLKNQSDPSLLTVRPLSRAASTMTVSPAGDLVCVGDAAGNGALLDALTCEVLVRLPTKNGRILDCAFSTDGRWLAIGYLSGEVSLISTAEGKIAAADGPEPPKFGAVVGRWKADGAIPVFLHFDAAGERLLVAGGVGQVRLLTVPEFNETFMTKVSPSTLKYAGFSSGEREIVTLDLLGTLTGLDPNTGEQRSVTRIGVDRQKIFMAVRDKATGRFVIGRDKGECDLWHPGSNTTALPTHDGAARKVAFSADGKFAVTAGMDNLVRVFDAETSRQCAQFADMGGAPTDVAFSPDRPIFAVASGDGAIRLYSSEDFTLVTTLPGHTTEVLTVAFIPGSPLLLSTSKDGTLKLWSIKPCEERLTGASSSSNAISRIVFCNGQLLAGRGTGEIERWDVHTPSFLRADLAHNQAGVTALLSLPDGLMLSSGDDGFVRLWGDADEPLVSIRVGKATVQRMALSRAGDLVAMVRKGAGVPALNLLAVSGQSLTRLDKVFDTGSLELSGPVVFGLNDSVIAAAGKISGVVLLDAVSGKPTGELNTGTGQINALAVSPDGKVLAAGGDARTVWLFDLETRAQVAALEGHTDAVRSLVWLPKANRLLSGGKDSSIRVWDPAMAQELCIAASVTGIVMDIAVSNDERMIAVVTEKGVRLICTNPIGKRLGAIALQSERLLPIVKALQDGPDAIWTRPIRGWLSQMVPDKVLTEDALLAVSLRAGGWLGRPMLNSAAKTRLDPLIPTQTRPAATPAKFDSALE